MCRIVPAECHLVVGERDESVIRDSNSMRVAAEIAKSVFWSSKRPLRIDHPLLTKGLTDELREGLGSSEWFQRTVKPEFATGKSVLKCVGELTSENFCQYVYRKEEL